MPGGPAGRLCCPSDVPIGYREDIDGFEACACVSEIPLTPGCDGKSFDNDGDEDRSDFVAVQRSYNGGEQSGNLNLEN